MTLAIFVQSSRQKSNGHTGLIAVVVIATALLAAEVVGFVWRPVEPASAPTRAPASRLVASAVPGGPNALSKGIRQAIERNLVAQSNGVTGKSGDFVSSSSGWRISSRGLDALVRTSGTVQVRAGQETFSLSPRTLSLPDAKSVALRVRSTTETADRLTQAMGPVVAWYHPSATGLEQGFTVKRPENGGRSGVLALGLGPAHGWQLSSGATELVAGGRAGLPLVSYRGLAASDAAGSALPAHLAITQGQVEIVVRTTATTVYPITIDPTLADANWTTSSSPTATLTKSSSASGDSEGFSVALSADGTTALVGAPFAGGGNGAVYLYHVSSASSWASASSPVVIADPGSSNTDAFGIAVTLSPDGTTAAIGGNQGGDGAVYVYHASSESAWSSASEVKTFTDPNSQTGDLFGDALSISSDGTTLLAGAREANVSPSPLAGAAYIYQASGEASWSSGALAVTLTNSSGVAGDSFGAAVALSGDGTTAAVGAPQAGALKGAADIYHATTETSWANASAPTVTLADPASASGDKFGGAISISSDGTTALVGALAQRSAATPHRAPPTSSRPRAPRRGRACPARRRRSPTPRAQPVTISVAPSSSPKTARPPSSEPAA